MSEEINYFDHLNELRNRLIIIVGSIGLLTGLSFVFSSHLMEIVTAPIRASAPELYFLSPYEAFVMRLKVSMTSGVLFSAPIIFFLLWSFVAPGLYEKEKRAIFPIVLISTVLFLSGVVFAYFFVIPFALRFFLGFQTETLRPLISIGAYVSFFLSLILIFGSVFLLPVVLVGLIQFGIVSTKTLSGHRRAVIVLAFIVSAVLTPTMDVVTQCFMALPLWGLFEISILIGKGIEKGRVVKTQ